MCIEHYDALQKRGPDVQSPIVDEEAGVTKFTDGVTIRWYGCNDPECKHWRVDNHWSSSNTPGSEWYKKNIDRIDNPDLIHKPPYISYNIKSTKAISDTVMHDINTGIAYVKHHEDATIMLFNSYERAIVLARSLREQADKATDKGPFLNSYISARRLCIELREAIFEREGN